MCANGPQQLPEKVKILFQMQKCDIEKTLVGYHPLDSLKVKHRSSWSRVNRVVLKIFCLNIVLRAFLNAVYGSVNNIMDNSCMHEQHTRPPPFWDKSHTGHITQIAVLAIHIFNKVTHNYAHAVQYSIIWDWEIET